MECVPYWGALFFETTLVKYNSSHTKVSEITSFKVNGKYTVSFPDMPSLSHKGTYTLKDGVLNLQGATVTGQSWHEVWYIMQDYSVVYTVFVKDLSYFIPSGTGNTPSVPDTPDNPNTPDAQTYTVTWKNYDGTVLETDESVAAGVTPTYDGQTPKKPTADGYEYTFSGWSPEISTVYGNQTYTAQFTVKLVVPELPQNTTPLLPTLVDTFDGDGTVESPYLIRTYAQLLGMGKFPDKHFALANPITLPSRSENQGRPNFTPLFSDETPFTGTFDGRDNFIDNLFLYNIETYYTGLFACIGSGGAVKNLTLKNVDIFGANYIGGVAGLSFGNISNCSVSGKITYVQNNDFQVYVGGIVGRMNGDNSRINECTSQTNIRVYKTTAGSSIGGITGSNISSSDITDCHNKGNIEVSDCAETTHVGGLAGTCSTRNISDSSNMGNIAVSTNNYTSYIGGLIGSGSTNITRCYNDGNITAANGSVYVGGIFGDKNDGEINYCYNSGDITVTDSAWTCAGGIGGGGGGQVAYSYNIGDITVSNYRSNTYIGGIVGSGSRITNCYTVGDIVAIATTNYSVNTTIGGIIGEGYGTVSCHWLKSADSVPLNAIGRNSEMGVPTNMGATKHTDIADFYTLATQLNEGLNEPVWENKTSSSLPTLITPVLQRNA